MGVTHGAQPRTILCVDPRRLHEELRSPLPISNCSSAELLAVLVPPLLVPTSSSGQKDAKVPPASATPPSVFFGVISASSSAGENCYH